MNIWGRIMANNASMSPQSPHTLTDKTAVVVSAAT